MALWGWAATRRLDEAVRKKCKFSLGEAAAGAVSVARRAVVLVLGLDIL